MQVHWLCWCRMPADRPLGRKSQDLQVFMQRLRSKRKSAWPGRSAERKSGKNESARNALPNPKSAAAIKFFQHHNRWRNLKTPTDWFSSCDHKPQAYGRRLSTSGPCSHGVVADFVSIANSGTRSTISSDARGIRSVKLQ